MTHNLLALAIVKSSKWSFTHFATMQELTTLYIGFSYYINILPVVIFMNNLKGKLKLSR